MPAIVAGEICAQILRRPLSDSSSLTTTTISPKHYLSLLVASLAALTYLFYNPPSILLEDSKEEKIEGAMNAIAPLKRLVVNPTARHTATVVIVHGLGVSHSLL